MALGVSRAISLPPKVLARLDAPEARAVAKLSWERDRSSSGQGATQQILAADDRSPKDDLEAAAAGLWEARRARLQFQRETKEQPVSVLQAEMPVELVLTIIAGAWTWRAEQDLRVALATFTLLETAQTIAHRLPAEVARASAVLRRLDVEQSLESAMAMVEFEAHQYATALESFADVLSQIQDLAAQLARLLGERAPEEA